MIKFRYKRKETTNGGGSNTSTLTKNSNTNTLTKNKSIEIKPNDSKDDINSNAVKCEKIDIKSTPQVIQVIKTKTNNEQDEYKENCIRAIVVSV